VNFHNATPANTIFNRNLSSSLDSNLTVTNGTEECPSQVGGSPATVQER
jgi:hypothetical protein